MQGTVNRLEPARRELGIETGTGTQRLHYDYLIYALGSLTDRDRAPGVCNYAYTLTPSGALSVEAFRMLGSAADAEDVVQDAYLRYQAVPSETIVSPKAFLSTIVTRLSLTCLESAHAQRETYIGPWLPEPVLTDYDCRSNPAEQLNLQDSLSMAFLVLLEELTPLERAVFLLREVFDYEYVEIAEHVGKEETACRQLFSRAKKHIAAHRPRFKPSREQHRRLLDRFLQAVRMGDLDGLTQLLADDVTLWADGGGKARGAPSVARARGRRALCVGFHTLHSGRLSR